MRFHHSYTIIVGALCILLLGITGSLGQHDHSRTQSSDDLGKVTFYISCGPESQRRFERGLALLHHMMYGQARQEFEEAADGDPGCAMARWGVAMTLFHPLWAEPTNEELKRGAAAMELARSLNAPTERERAYIAAAEAFYRDWQTVGHSQRLAAWEAGQQRVYTLYSADPEAAAFYALAKLATAPKEDKTFSHQKDVETLLRALHARAPNHPGLFHYIIHASDNPLLAGRAVDVARGYNALAPEVPHALHMPTHIFVRLGLWPDVIDWNVRSADAAKRQAVGGVASLHFIHALDYLIYAYLQQSQERKAHAVLREVNAVEKYENSFAAAYGIAAVQARYPLERAQWADAAVLPVRTHRAFPWDTYPWFEAITYFARGLGAARSGNIPEARKALGTLNEFYDRSINAGQHYWAVHVDAHRKTVEAWIAYADGEMETAVAKMREAADVEDSVDKHPVTPGAVLPARELLGDMLRDAGRPADAFTAYEAALTISPNRFKSLFGAGRAAELMGNLEKAGEYYAKLVALTAEADTEKSEIALAKRFLASAP